MWLLGCLCKVSLDFFGVCRVNFGGFLRFAALPATPLPLYNSRSNLGMSCFLWCRPLLFQQQPALCIMGCFFGLDANMGCRLVVEQTATRTMLTF